MDLLFPVIFFAYLPVQIAFLVVGLMMLLKKPRTRKRLIWGIVDLVLFALMLPFTPVVVGLAFLLLTGGSFGA